MPSRWCTVVCSVGNGGAQKYQVVKIRKEMLNWLNEILVERIG